MRLPPGYARLKDNLGQIIRVHRLASTGTDAPLPPKLFAHRVGISRVTLSRIEHDRAWPRSETLEAIIDIFGIDWSDVAEPGVTRSPPRRIPDTLQDLQRDTLCRALRAGRIALG
jgi:transcriptional regulator with XRE-family HTH domain